MPNPADPQSWNRYSYVNNSPINYNDPTGHYVADTLDGECDPEYVWDACDDPDEIFSGDDGDASNVWELMKLGKDYATHGNIIGAGLQSLQDDPSVQAAQGRLVVKIRTDPRYGQEAYDLPDSAHLSEIFTANGPSRKWYIAAITGNQAFFMVHTATLSATNTTVSADRTISTTWKVDDNFDYIPDWEGHGWEYNHFAILVHFFYNDVWGAKEQFPTNAYWDETIPPDRNHILNSH